MSIRNLDHYIDALWDWGIFDDCFGGKIKVSDIDGIVERRGQFLLLEAKSPGTEIPKGQQILHDALYRLGCFTILYIWGQPGEPEWVRFRPPALFPLYEGPATLDDLRNMVKWWYQIADSRAFSNPRKARLLPPPPYPHYTTAVFAMSTA